MFWRRSLRQLQAFALVFVLLAPGAVVAQDVGTTRLIVEAGNLLDIPREIRLTADVRPLGRSSFLQAWYAVEVPDNEADDVIQDLQQAEGILSVRREYIYQTAAIPDDPLFSEQYGLRSTQLPLADINAPQAWDVTTGSSSTVIAIVDGGVDLNHEDLQGKIWTNSDEVAGNDIDDDNNGFVDDVYGWDFYSNRPAGEAIDHGTHVAGIAAAKGNNGLGIAGVDWGAKIMSVRVLSRGGAGGEQGIIEGIEYAVDNGADVINLSLVGSQSEALQAAIAHAYSSGVVVVAAAGNSGRNTSIVPVFPACADGGGVNMVIGVGATDDEAEATGFSNYGDCVDVSAPGYKIVSTTVDNDYNDMTGTSMSAPFVAGAAGLYLASHPGAPASEVISAITGSAGDIEDGYGGHLDLAALVGVSVNESIPSPEASPTPTSQPQSTSSESSGSSSSGGGGGDSGGGGGGGGGGSEEAKPAVKPKAKPKVLGAKTVKPNPALIPQINAAFRLVFGRNPLVVEHGYWFLRVKRGDKRTFIELVGAMAYQKAKGFTYVPSKK